MDTHTQRLIDRERDREKNGQRERERAYLPFYPSPCYYKILLMKKVSITIHYKCKY
jgi:hypothetical protein